MQKPATVLQIGWKMCCGHNVAVERLKTSLHNSYWKFGWKMCSNGEVATRCMPRWIPVVEMNGICEGETSTEKAAYIPVPVADFVPTTLHTLQATASNEVVMVPLSAAANNYYLFIICYTMPYMSNEALVRPGRSSPTIIMQSQVRWKIYSFFWHNEWLMDDSLFAETCAC